jgi:hypothetical protein
MRRRMFILLLAFLPLPARALLFSQQGAAIPANLLELEDGSGTLLLEDGSGSLQLES